MAKSEYHFILDGEEGVRRDDAFPEERGKSFRLMRTGDYPGQEDIFVMSLRGSGVNTLNRLRRRAQERKLEVLTEGVSLVWSHYELLDSFAVWEQVRLMVFRERVSKDPFLRG